MIDYNEIKKDLRSFADEEEYVLFDNIKGTVILTRNGKDIELTLKEIDNSLYVNYNDTDIKYRDFLSKELARLDIFANKILEKKEGIEPYIDAKATLNTSSEKKSDDSLKLLSDECENKIFFGTKITFVTADAGHGKTVLLNEFQKLQAQRFINGESNFVFWHIDLQGRDLVRLNEAIMYDLGLLRVSGLYFSSILTLMKHNLIILGIDGFDELAAEIGGENALGSLSSLVLNMNSKGTLIAASRRTFFNTQDYIKRTKLLHKKITQDCEFDELKIANWEKNQNIEYLGYYFNNPEDKYKDILSVIKDDKHPILSRPYLFTKIVEILQSDDITLEEFLDISSNNFYSINEVIEAFVKREVLKWKYRDKDTGKPYLTFDQHIYLLSVIASEMWENQIEYLNIENIQFLLTMLLEDWKIEEEIKAIRMIESHALLIPVSNRDNFRKFDHIEFKNYFIAKALFDLINKALEGNNKSSLKKFLYIAQLPDSVANYLSSLTSDINVNKIIDLFKEILSGEWKPTYLQPNIGTIIPYVLNCTQPEKTILIDNKLSFSSIVFEGKSLTNIIFRNCNFVNISLSNTEFKNITIEDSTFNELRLCYESENVIDNVHIKNCDINAVVLIDKDGERYPEYTPSNIQSTLKNFGFIVDKSEDNIEVKEIVIKNIDFNKAVKRFITKFNKAMYQYEVDIRKESNYKNPKIIFSEIIPLLEKYKIIEEVDTKKTRQASSKAWRLLIRDIEYILKAEEDKQSDLFKFWLEVNDHD